MAILLRTVEARELSPFDQAKLWGTQGLTEEGTDGTTGGVDTHVSGERPVFVGLGTEVVAVPGGVDGLLFVVTDLIAKS